MEYTIGIPVFNGEDTLSSVLDAIQDQQPRPKQVIVVDDGSTDGSASTAFSFKVKVVSHPQNKGLAEARNTILRNCQSEILIFFDADAVPLTGCIQSLLAPFEDPDVGAVGGRGIEAKCDTRAGQWRARTTPQSHGQYRIDDDWMLMGLCVAFRASALRDIGGFDATFTCAGEDVDISLRLSQNGWKLIYVPDAKVDHIPSESAVDVTLQAYKHAKYASYALLKNGQSPRDYMLDSFRCLAHHAKEDLVNKRFYDFIIGTANAAARTTGILAGSVKASLFKQGEN